MNHSERMPSTLPMEFIDRSGNTVSMHVDRLDCVFTKEELVAKIDTDILIAELHKRDADTYIKEVLEHAIENEQVEPDCLVKYMGITNALQGVLERTMAAYSWTYLASELEDLIDNMWSEDVEGLREALKRVIDYSLPCDQEDEDEDEG